MSFDPFVWQQAPYAHHPLHALLETDAGRPEGPNIGSEGQHLTVAAQFVDESALRRLAEGVANHLHRFAGELLVVVPPRRTPQAQGAERILRSFAFRSRLVVAQADSLGHLRNCAARQATTNWLLWLQPGVDILWNVLASLQTDLGQLGCHFLGVRAGTPEHSLNESFHLAPSLERKDVSVGLGRPGPEDPGGAFLATALSGIGSLMRVDSLLAIGGYDETLDGLEDIEFSIRAYRAGHKIGVSSRTGLRWMPGEPSNTLEGHGVVDPAVRRRFEDRYGLGVTTPQAPAVEDEAAEAAASDPRPRIALIIDVEDWAFANIARQVMAALGDEFAFDMIPVGTVEDIPRLIMMCEQADLIHFFWREVINTVHAVSSRDQVNNSGLGYEHFLEKFLRPKVVTTAIYDHLFVTPEAIAERVELFTAHVDSYYACSQRLHDIYAAIPAYKPPSAVLPDGVDLSVFRPDKLERFERMNDRPIVVGWVGNSAWANHLGDPKGVHTILKPALEQLTREGVPVIAHFADRQQRMIPHAEMPAYYGEVDVLICTSEIEGTPNPVLEAMACGVPVITTDVGVVPQAFGPLQKGFILPERSTQALMQAIGRLDEDRALFARLSAENLASIQAWDWPLMAARFGPFFRDALRRKGAKTPDASVSAVSTPTAATAPPRVRGLRAVPDRARERTG